MTRVVLALHGLAKTLGAAPELIRRLERSGLVVPLGRDKAGQVWVDADARRQVERVQSLITAGYAEKDIALVIGRIERSDGRARVAEIVGLDELAVAAGVPPETLRRWLDGALLETWAVAEDGASMFLRSAIEVARALGALETLGLGEHVGTWAALVRGAAPDKAATAALEKLVKERLEQVDGAARTLRSLLPRLGVAAGTKPRRRLLSRRKDTAKRSTVAARSEEKKR